MWTAIYLFSLIASIVVFAMAVFRPWSGTQGSEDETSYIYKELTSKGGVYGLRVGIDLKNPCHFSIKRETVVDRFFKRIGLTQEYQVNIEDFDHDYFIVSDNDLVHQHLKEDAVLRSSIETLFTDLPDGCKKVRSLICVGKRLWVEYKSNSSGKETAPAVCVPLLKKIEQALSLNSAEAPQYSDKAFAPATILSSICIAPLLLSVFVSFLLFSSSNRTYIVDSRPLTSDAAMGALIITAALILVAFYYLRKTSRIHFALMTILICGSASTFLTTWSTMRLADTEFDSSAATAFQAPVDDKWITSGKHKAHLLSIHDWAGRNTSITVEPKLSTFNAVQPGDTVTIYQRAGFLGYRWVSAIEKS